MKLVRLLGFSLAAGLALTGSARAADCVSSCMAAKDCGLGYEAGRVTSTYCSLSQSLCEMQCRSSVSPPSGPSGPSSSPSSGYSGGSGKYGAIAYSPSTARWGDSFDYGSRAQAEQRARAECGQGDCLVAVWYGSGRCGAVASAADGFWAGGIGATQAAAGGDALAGCAKNGRQCAVQQARCQR